MQKRSNTAKQNAHAFYNELKGGIISCPSLEAALEKRGYTVIEYSKTDESPEAVRLLSALGLLVYAQSVKGFTFQNPEYRLVFVNADLSEQEKCIVLAHEAGHIVCRHMSNQSIIGADVRQEYEANEFAHYLLNPGKGFNILYFVKRNRKAVLAVMLTLVLLFAGVFAGVSVSRQGKGYGEYYVTATGIKYHKKECIFVKYKNNVRRLTEEEYENEVYAPCDVCLPDK